MLASLILKNTFLCLSKIKQPSFGIVNLNIIEIAEFHSPSHHKHVYYVVELFGCLFLENNTTEFE